MATRVAMETQSKTRYKHIAIVLTAMMGLILAGNAGLTAAIVQLSQKWHQTERCRPLAATQ